MGYRSRLGKIPKSAKEIYDGKTFDEVMEIIGENGSVDCPPEHIQLYEMGKYYEFSKGTVPFYSFDIYKECESEFCIMNKGELKQLIFDYHEIIFKNYKDMNEGEDSTNFIASRTREWSRQFDLLPYYLDQEHCDGELATSWQYEYAIFNIVYIYKTFDWENDFLIYSAW